MGRHILPNITAPIIVVFTISIGAYILAEAGLASGLGDPVAISWGKMVNEDADWALRSRSWRCSRVWLSPSPCWVSTSSVTLFVMPRPPARAQRSPWLLTGKSASRQQRRGHTSGPLRSCPITLTFALAVSLARHDRLVQHLHYVHHPCLDPASRTAASYCIGTRLPSRPRPAGASGTAPPSASAARRHIRLHKRVDPRRPQHMSAPLVSTSSHLPGPGAAPGVAPGYAARGPGGTRPGTPPARGTFPPAGPQGPRCTRSRPPPDGRTAPPAPPTPGRGRAGRRTPSSRPRTPLSSPPRARPRSPRTPLCSPAPAPRELQVTIMRVQRSATPCPRARSPPPARRQHASHRAVHLPNSSPSRTRSV
jgi:hypothetical protein